MIINYINNDEVNWWDISVVKVSLLSMSMISHEISWWDISVVQVIQVIQVMQLIQVMQVRLAHLWPDFRLICTKKCTLFPNGDPSNVILLFVRWLKTEIVKKKLRNICMTHVPVENRRHCIYISKDAYCK